MKRWIALLLTLSLLLTSVPISVAAEDDELLEVYVKTYSNTLGTHTIEGYYRDNVFYISASAVAGLTGASVQDPTETTVTFSLHGGKRIITVDAASDTMSEQQNKKSCNTAIPAVSKDGEVYVSAPALLRYMGAVVSFGEDEQSPTHMMVSMPYTVMDLMHEYETSNGYRFRWSEADGKLVDPGDVVVLAALDTVLFAYDSNILAYAIPGHADKIEKQMHTDALLEVLKTDSSMFVQDSDPVTDLLGYLDGQAQFTTAWVSEVLAWYEDADVAKASSIGMSTAVQGANIFLSGTEAINNSLDVVQQFASMNATQKELLKNTIAAVPSTSGLYQRLPLLFEAAKDASKFVEESYNGTGKAVWDGVYTMLTGVGSLAASAFCPLLAAWDQVAAIVKNAPIFAELIQDEKSITYANDCYNVANVGDILYECAASTFDEANRFAGTSDVRSQELIKLCAILSLKGTLATRRLLLDTGWLKDSAVSAMTARCDEAAMLLNRAINAKPVPPAVGDTTKEDITWIRHLIRTGSSGWVNRIGGTTYYWTYNNQSYEKEYWNTLPMGAESGRVTMTFRDEDGKETKWFSVEGVHPFAATTAGLYCTNNGNLYFYPFDRTERQYLGQGEILAISSSGSHLILVVGNGISSLDLETKKRTSIHNNATFLTMHNDVVYYQPTLSHEEEMQDHVKLMSAHADGSHVVTLFYGKDRMYDSMLMHSGAFIMQMHFDEEYVYFSYGAGGGTSNMYQGGRIARVRYDGSDASVVAGRDKLVDYRFTVSNGTVDANELEHSAMMFLYRMAKFEMRGDVLYAVDSEDGDYTHVIERSHYTNAGEHSTVEWMQQIGDRVYFLVHFGKEKETYGWRILYTRARSALYCKNLTDNSFELIAEF